MASTSVQRRQPCDVASSGAAQEQLVMVDFNNHLIVKCVVVGDQGVGKSHLVCSRASGTKYTMRGLVLQTHISSVWSVDQYRDNYEVRRRSRCDIDGVACSLRIWDTFGNHDRDRQYAYMHTDVVVICFSAINRRSLINIEKFWIPEVRRTCGMVPIIICCCMIDYRYLFTEPAYVNLDKGPFAKKVRPGDIVLPEEGRAVARKFGASYYESSVLAQYGIDDVFNNAVRASLFQRRRSQIFSKIGNLKRVAKPHLQVPHLPPKPSQPEFEPPEPPAVGQLRSVRSRRDLQSYCDVTFVLDGGTRLYAHWVYLIAASPAFRQLYDQRRRRGRPLNLSRSSGFISSVSSSSTVIGGSSSGSGSGSQSSSDATLNSWAPPWRREGVRVRMSSRIRYLSQNLPMLPASRRKTMPVGGDDDAISVDGGGRLRRGHRMAADSENDLMAASKSASERRQTMDAAQSTSSLVDGGDYDGGSSEAAAAAYRRQLQQPSEAASTLTLTPAHGDDDDDDDRNSVEADNEEEDDETDCATEISDIDSAYANRTASAATSDACLASSSSAFVSIEVRCGNGVVGDFEETVVVVEDWISAETFEDVLHFVYTGQLPAAPPDDEDGSSDNISGDKMDYGARCERLNRVAKAVGFEYLDDATVNALNGEPYLNVELRRKFDVDRATRIRELFVEQSLLADVLFELEDGTVPAHRALLMCRCDMMVSMFNLDFNERFNRTVPFRSATMGGFRGLMTYLYTGQCPNLCDDWASLVELADRLCLPQLLHDAELKCVNHLSLQSTAGGGDLGDLTDAVLALVDTAKLHGTHQIERWCLWFLQVNFSEVLDKHINAFELLQPATQDAIIQKSWPPAWYLKEVDVYERALMLMTKERPESSWLRRPNGEVQDPTHCFGFLRLKK